MHPKSVHLFKIEEGMCWNISEESCYSSHQTCHWQNNGICFHIWMRKAYRKVTDSMRMCACFDNWIEFWRKWNWRHNATKQIDEKCHWNRLDAKKDQCFWFMSIYLLDLLLPKKVELKALVTHIKPQADWDKVMLLKWHKSKRWIP